MMVDQPLTIAIDGPAASGKSTIGLMLAERIGYIFLDTGSMYRTATLAALRSGVSIHDETAVVALSEQIHIDIGSAAGYDDERMYTVWLDGDDVTWDIRLPDVEKNVSQVSAYWGVREQMVRLQRAMGQRGRVVMVGRDIGTVVLPDAPLKLYITASAEERARRRWLEKQERGDDGSAYDAILADIKRRDTIDSGREHSPLRPADDAIIIDTSEKSPEQLLDEILSLPAFQTISAD